LLVGAIGLPIVSSFGYLPKLGPGRALFLAVRSRISSSRTPPTLRTKELAVLREDMNDKRPQQYTIVTGPKGVGKTTLLNTLLLHKAGVVSTTVSPGKQSDDIVHATLLQVTGSHPSLFSPEPTAKRVIFFYKYLRFLPHLMMGVTVVTTVASVYLQYVYVLGAVSLAAAYLSTKLYPGRSPTIVMHTEERSAADKFAGITGAVRRLRDTYGLSVIVDGSPNSLDDTLFRTTRQSVFYIQPLLKEEVLELPQFKGLPEEIRNDTVLCDLILDVMGGIPSKYETLLRLTVGETPQVAQERIQQALIEELREAWKTIRDSKIRTPDMEKILALFKWEGSNLIPILSLQLEEKKLIRPSPDKVLHEKILQDEFVLVPATNAIRIVLQYNLKRIPTFKELKSLVSQPPPKINDEVIEVL